MSSTWKATNENAALSSSKSLCLSQRLFGANTPYGENYETMPMQHVWVENDSQRTVAYRWEKNSVWQSFEVTTELQSSPIEETSETEFITEYYWGYAVGFPYHLHITADSASPLLRIIFGSKSNKSRR
jgi:hypothetical protein